MEENEKIREWTPEDDVNFDATELSDVLEEAIADAGHPILLTLLVRGSDARVFEVKKATLTKGSTEDDYEIWLDIDEL